MNENYYNKCFFEKQYWWRFSNILSMLDDRSILLEKDFVNFNREDLYYACDGELGDFLDVEFPSFTEEVVVDDVPTKKVIQPIYDIFMLLQKRFAQHYVFSTRAEDADEAKIEAWKFIRKLFNVMEYTYKKYSKIIELYDSNYNDLMKLLESTSEGGSRFNDTPQSAEVNLSFEENQFTTNLTKTKQTTRTDSNTPIVKIEEIWQNYRKVILEWLNEFESLFVEENNL